MNKQEVEAYVAATYGIEADHPFLKYPSVTVFRHPDNRKWFGIIMSVAKEKLILGSEGWIDILNIKCADEILPSFLSERGIFPAYHMSKGHWLTVALDGSAADETVQFLLDVSFSLTASKRK